MSFNSNASYFMSQAIIEAKIAFEQEKTCPKAICVSTLISYLIAFF